jgi:hypothetical protein
LAQWPTILKKRAGAKDIGRISAGTISLLSILRGFLFPTAPMDEGDGQPVESDDVQPTAIPAASNICATDFDVVSYQNAYKAFEWERSTELHLAPD